MCKSFSKHYPMVKLNVVLWSQQTIRSLFRVKDRLRDFSMSGVVCKLFADKGKIYVTHISNENPTWFKWNSLFSTRSTTGASTYEIFTSVWASTAALSAQ